MIRTSDELPGGAERKTWLDRALSLFTEVRAGEGVTALLLATNIFSLLAFYSVLKIVRDSLILTEGGAEVKSYAAAGQALLLLGFVPAYGAFASRVNRVRLIAGVTLFFASHLIVFYLLGVGGVRVGVAFFLWTGVFSLVAVAQFWAFANDVYSTERGKRLFPLVGVGALLGATVGAGATSVAFAGTGPYRLMLLAAAGLLVPVLLTLWVNQRERTAVDHDRPSRADEPIGKAGGFQLVFSQRYLLLIALLVLILNVVNTLGGFLLDRLILEEAARRTASDAAGGLNQMAVVGSLAGSVQFAVNLLGFVFQAFLVSRIFKYAGIRAALFILPIIAFAGYSLIAILPIFSIVRAVKILENSTDYSIQQTTRHALFLPTSREAKYKAKQAIESFFWRAGDLLQAVVVFVGVQLAFGIRGFAAINVALTLCWLTLVVAIAQEHRKLTAADATEKAA